jgi:hypothetical protein
MDVAYLHQLNMAQYNPNIFGARQLLIHMSMVQRCHMAGDQIGGLPLIDLESSYRYNMSNEP